MSKLSILLQSPEALAAKVILAGVIDIAGLQDEIQQGEDFINLAEDEVEELNQFLDDAVALQPDLNEQLGAAVALIVLFANKSGSPKFKSIASKLEQLYETYTGEKGDLGKLLEGVLIVLQGEKRSINKLSNRGNVTQNLIDPTDDAEQERFDESADNQAHGKN